MKKTNPYFVIIIGSIAIGLIILVVVLLIIKPYEGVSSLIWVLLFTLISVVFKSIYKFVVDPEMFNLPLLANWISCPKFFRWLLVINFVLSIPIFAISKLFFRSLLKDPYSDYMRNSYTASFSPYSNQDKVNFPMTGLSIFAIRSSIFNFISSIVIFLLIIYFKSWFVYFVAPILVAEIIGIRVALDNTLPPDSFV